MTHAIKSVKKYNLPSAKRHAPKCLKGKALEVTKVDGDPATEDAMKVYLQCDEARMPRPYQMVKEKGKWLFKKI